MEKRYINDEILKPTLDNITLLLHLYHKKIHRLKKIKILFIFAKLLMIDMYIIF